MSDIVERDLRYDMHTLYKGSKYLAMLSAVLTPVFGATDWNKDLPSSAFGALSDLRRLWKARLYDFRDAGWLPLMRADEKAAAFQMICMRNCPPFAVKTSLRSCPCKRSSICPFCYARAYVLAPYVKLEQFLFGSNPSAEDGNGWVKAKPGFRLIEFRYALRLYMDDRKLLTPDAVAYLTGVARTWMSQTRRREIDLVSPAVGAVLYRVSIRKRYLSLRRSVVMVASASEAAPNLAVKKNKNVTATQQCAVHEEVTKTVLYQAVARCFAYPASLLQAPASLVAALLHGLKGFHLLSTYGG